jgi:hypothetical protein
MCGLADEEMYLLKLVGRRTFIRTLPVCSAENVSVEKSASTHSQTSVGTHAHTLRGEAAETGS